MISEKNIKEKILMMIEELKEKKILVEVKFQEDRNKFNVYSPKELNSLYYKITYLPKNFLLKEDEYYMDKFPAFLSSLESKAEKIDYLLKDLDEDSIAVLENVKYNSYFHFTEDKVIINVDNFIKGKKYIVFNTSNSFEKIMYILDENNEYVDILDEIYLKILKKLSLISNL